MFHPSTRLVFFSTEKITNTQGTLRMIWIKDTTVDRPVDGDASCSVFVYIFKMRVRELGTLPLAWPHIHARP